MERHVYCVFQYGDTRYSFRYINQLRKGDIVDSSCKTLNDIIMLKEVPWLFEHFRDVFETKKVRSKTIIIDGAEMDIWDKFVDSKVSQVKLLDYINTEHQKRNDIIVRETFGI